MKTTPPYALIALLSCIVLPTVASAQEDGKRRGPPPEAIEACANQPEEAACSFSGKRGEVAGSCIVPRKGDGQLICAPEGGRGNNQ